MSNRDLQPSVIGQLLVTVVYRIDVHDLTEYNAADMQDAAQAQAEWYADGSDYPAEALSYTKPDSITVEVVPS